MTNLNNNELSSRTNLRNLIATAKAGLHKAVIYPCKRRNLLALLLLGAVAAAASVVGIHVPRAVAAAVGPVALGKGTVVRGRRKGALRTARGGWLLRRAFLGRRHEVNVVILCIGSQTEESCDQE